MVTNSSNGFPGGAYSISTIKTPGTKVGVGVIVRVGVEVGSVPVTVGVEVGSVPVTVGVIVIVPVTVGVKDGDGVGVSVGSCLATSGR
jgi:hypothetical protein